MSDLATEKMKDNLEAQKKVFEEKMRGMFEFRMTNVLREKGKENLLKCEICGEQMKFNNAPVRHIMLEEDAFSHLMGAKFGNLGSIFSSMGAIFGGIAGRGREIHIPAIMFICYNCGNLRNHSLMILGVDWETMAQEIANDIVKDGTAIETLQKAGPLGIVNTTQRNRHGDQRDNAPADGSDTEAAESGMGDTDGDQAG
jgi:hypothetical protein